MVSSATYELEDGDVENLTLAGADALNGTGNDLANTITGNTGSNQLRGGNGNDTLRGGAGDDSLYGEDNNDTMIGGQGSDVLRGGDDDDVYSYTRGDGADKLLDYDQSETDSADDIAAAKAAGVYTGSGSASRIPGSAAIYGAAVAGRCRR